MKCPSCSAELKMTERQGVEIDYCPECRGVWLDRGELDKIIDRSLAAAGSPGQQGGPYGAPGSFDQQGHHGRKRRFGGFFHH